MALLAASTPSWSRSQNVTQKEPVSLTCKTGTSFDIISTSSPPARKDPNDGRRRLAGTDAGFISTFRSELSALSVTVEERVLAKLGLIPAGN